VLELSPSSRVLALTVSDRGAAEIGSNGFLGEAGAASFCELGEAPEEDAGGAEEPDDGVELAAPD
jgi:hypothetical protein